jgi:hypothetical protein
MQNQEERVLELGIYKQVYTFPLLFFLFEIPVYIDVLFGVSFDGTGKQLSSNHEV